MKLENKLGKRTSIPCYQEDLNYFDFLLEKFSKCRNRIEFLRLLMAVYAEKVASQHNYLVTVEKPFCEVCNKYIDILDLRTNFAYKDGKFYCLQHIRRAEYGGKNCKGA